MKTAKGITVLTLLLLAGWACAGDGSGSGTGGDDEIVGYIGTEKITRAQVSEKVSAQLVQLRQQEYDILTGGFDTLVNEQLLAREAKARGITVDELVKTEVDDKLQGPSTEAVDQFYNQNKARLGGRSREEAGPDIERYMRQLERAQVYAKFVDGLRSKASVRVALEPPRVDVPIPDSAPSLGPEDASVVMVEFSDFQCPYCKRAEPTVERILAEYGDRIRFVYRDYPLPMHNRALPSAKAARCAGEQEKYWEYHTSLMTGVGNLDDEDLKKKAEALQLDMDKFQACLDADRYADEIQASIDDGARLGVNGTPAFFINGRLVSGAQPYDSFKKLLDEELARTSPSSGADAGAR